VGLDPARGFDHGTFAPMAVIYPEADVPILELSLKRGLDPLEQLAVGRALAPLRNEGVLIVGGGSNCRWRLLSARSTALTACRRAIRGFDRQASTPKRSLARRSLHS